MNKIHSVLGKKVQLCVRKANFLDAKMDEFGHTSVHFAFHTQNARRRDAFDPLSRRKCSKLLAVTCAFLLRAGQNRLRLNSIIPVNGP